MRKLLLVAISAILASCGQSAEEKALTYEVQKEYKAKQIAADMSVPFNILNLSVKNKEQHADTTIYKVEFDIQETHPSRRVYYKGHTTIKKLPAGRYEMGMLHYHENSKLNR